jgi:hypothetical protein
MFLHVKWFMLIIGSLLCWKQVKELFYEEVKNSYAQTKISSIYVGMGDFTSYRIIAHLSFMALAWHS